MNWRQGTASSRFRAWTRLTLLGLFAASFHFLWDIPNVGGMPVRFGASDLLLLIFLVLAALDWRHLRVAIPRVQRSAALWLGAVAAIMVLAFLRGPRGDLVSRSWAVVKLAGFFVLAGYFAIGWLAASRIGFAGRRFFCRAFLVAASACAAYAVVRYLLAFWRLLPARTIRAWPASPGTPTPSAC